jgi:broad specificity phosphatase PhoE
MSKPINIALVRHGQSVGNEDKSLYTSIPDFTMTLTKLGRKQAYEAGVRLRNLFGDEKVMFYVSPFWRTRQTYEEIARSFPNHIAREEPRLREQEWGYFHVRTDNVSNEQQNCYGNFYYRIPEGESCADVYDRCSSALDTIYRDFENPDFPKHMVIVGHGMANRVMLMRWLHYSVEYCETNSIPHNVDFFLL